MTNKLFCFKINGDIIENISYEDYIAQNPTGNKINWDSYKDQLTRPEGSINVEYFENARYISVKNKDGMYYFGMGLSKELLKKLTGVNVEPVKAFILFKDKTYKQISKEELYEIADKDDISTLDNIYEYKEPFEQLGVLTNDNILYLYIGTEVNADKMKEIVDDQEGFNQLLQQEATAHKLAQSNVEKHGNANYSKPSLLNSFILKAAGLFAMSLLKKITPQNFNNYTPEDKKQFLELRKQTVTLLKETQNYKGDKPDDAAHLQEIRLKIDKISEQMKQLTSKYGDAMDI